MRRHKILTRVLLVVTAIVVAGSIGIEIFQSRQTDKNYVLPARTASFLPKTNPTFAAKLNFNDKQQAYVYNGNKPASASGVTGASNAPYFSAKLPMDTTQPTEVTDTANNVTLSIKSKFPVGAPRKEENRLVYPLPGRNAAKVYTLQAGTLKEDLVLNSYIGDTYTVNYELGLPEGSEARMLPNGSVGIFGVRSELLGNVTTGTDKDAELLKQARQNGEKTNLLFTLPAPVVLEGYKKVSKSAKAGFVLNGNTLTVTTKGLKDANYPLSIDPSVYIETAQKFMRGNNETNVDFDVSNELIQKSQTTGARIDSWTSTSDLPSSIWDQGTVAAGGYVYSVGGTSGNETHKFVYSTQGSATFTVPASGVSSISVKAWGGGGAGGGGSSTGVGGAGGGAGYAGATLSVSANETINVYVGGGGTGGVYSANGNTAGAGGGGGGYSSVYRSTTPLVIAAGGGGGGGSRNGTVGAAGGAGQNTTGEAGSTVNTGTSTGGGGGAGTPTTGGAAGVNSSGGNDGSAGSSLNGGNGGDGRNGDNAGAKGNGGAGGQASGGSGGSANVNTTRPGGGGGGSGYFGGGGGAASNSSNGFSGGGGGSGSSYADSGATNVSYTGSGSLGSGTSPGNASDSDRTGSAGDGGAGGATTSTGTSGTNGLVIISYTISGSTTPSSTVSWAKFNTTTGSIDSPTDGNGLCSGWCTNSAYNLPAGRRALSVVSYNGFLYALGGIAASGCTGTSHTCNTVYIAKLGANGEPQLWHPTDTNKNNWVYWYSSTNTLSTERAYSAAVAYNNRLYLLGGKTDSTSGVTTVEVADLKPTGDIGSWSTSGMSTLPGASGGRFGHTVYIYNDTMYVIGGRSSSSTFYNDTWYVHLNSTGTMNSWIHTNDFSTGRMTYGGSFTALWGGYIYLGGGCTALNGSGYCTNIASDVQLASINADGSIAEWNTILNLTNQRMGYTFLAWQNGLYRLGGCDNQNSSTGVCDNTLYSVDYGEVNQDGDASTVSNSSPANTSPCSGATPTNCDLPAPGDSSEQGGQMSSMLVINNGYIYNIGGCTNISGTNECSGGTAMSGNVSYAILNSNGQMGKAATCGGTFVTNSLWCSDSTNRINGTNGVGAAAATVFNNTIYVIGGTTGNGTWTSNLYYTALNSDGSLAGGTTWTTGVGTGTTGLPTSFPGTGTNGIGYGFAFTRANPASAGSVPGHLFYMGGCNGTGGIGCSNYTTGVYRCSISTTGAVSGCSTTNQMQIDSDNINTGSQGLGLMAGAVYANRVYLVGGSCAQVGTTASAPCGATYAANRQDTIYAKIDNSNNIVDNSTGSSSGSWAFTSGKMNPVRRRAVSFGYNGYIYSLAGYSGTASLQDLLFAKIDVSTGDMGDFSSSGVVVTPRWDLRAIVSNGYVYAIGGCATGTAPSGCTAMQQQIQTFQLYNNDSGAPVSYSSGNNIGVDRIGGSATLLNGYLYYAGGCTDTACATVNGTVYYAAVDADGGIGTFSTGNALPSSATRTWGKLLAAGNTLYYVGGQTGAGINTAVGSIYYTTSFSSGNPTWNSSTATKGIGDTGAGAQARTQFGATVWNNRIYVAGGYNASSTVQSTVYVSPDLSAGGNITSNWTSSTAFNVARAGVAMVSYANNLYLFGGYDGTNYLNDSQFASLGYKVGTITQSGSTVTSASGSPTFTSSMIGSTLFYAADGSTSTITAVPSSTTLTVDVSKTVSSATSYTIQDGSVGSWTYSTSMPGAVRDGEAFASNGYLYLIGGRSAATTCLPNTLVTPISANTTIASGNNPTGVGEWYETNQKYTADRYGASAVYIKGRAYVLGGGCSSMVTSTDRTYYSTLKSQPQVAKYSRLIDTDTDVFPTKWLLNGLDNSIGARWQLSYRSMTNTTSTCSYSAGTISQSTTTVTGSGTNWTSSFNGGTIVYSDGSTATISTVSSTTSMTVSVSKTVTAGSSYSIIPPAMTTWGQDYSYGNVTLGTPGVYTMRYGDGNPLSCARFYYLAVSIDASQTFGYPEDVTRGPTITDMSLFFTADPSKRLRHGKTFTGGEKQPLNTPF